MECLHQSPYSILLLLNVQFTIYLECTKNICLAQKLFVAFTSIYNRSNTTKVLFTTMPLLRSYFHSNITNEWNAHFFLFPFVMPKLNYNGKENQIKNYYCVFYILKIFINFFSSSISHFKVL